jgi:hypothetical protein
MKKESIGMKDMFEQAKQDIIERYNTEIEKKQQVLYSLEANINKYDSGIGDIEDRQERNYIEREIRALEKQRDAEVAALSANGR